MNESVFAAIGGLVGIIGAAGVISQIEMALEDPTISEKYPKLAKVFELNPFDFINCFNLMQ